MRGKMHAISQRCMYVCKREQNLLARQSQKSSRLQLLLPGMVAEEGRQNGDVGPISDASVKDGP
eukprot:scaffold501141_cov48-Prasinocladus_malaysianus.AAC.1